MNRQPDDREALLTEHSLLVQKPSRTWEETERLELIERHLVQHNYQRKEAQ